MKFNKKRNLVAHDLDYTLTKNDCEIQKKKCKQYYFQLSLERFKKFKEMKIYELIEKPEK